MSGLIVIVESLSRSNSLRPHGLQPARLLCPWDSPGKNAGVGCHLLLQGIFPVEGLNLRLWHHLHWQADSLPMSHQGSLDVLSKQSNLNVLCYSRQSVDFLYHGEIVFMIKELII